MGVGTRLYTAADLAKMPGDEPWEIWEGELRRVPGAGGTASGLAHRIGVRISLFVEPRSFRDAELEYRLMSTLGALPGVDLSRVTIRSVRGAVTLSGNVPSQAAIDRILIAANNTSGVVVLRDQLAIAPGATSMAITRMMPTAFSEATIVSASRTSSP